MIHLDKNRTLLSETLTEIRDTIKSMKWNDDNTKNRDVLKECYEFVDDLYRNDRGDIKIRCGQILNLIKSMGIL